MSSIVHADYKVPLYFLLVLTCNANFGGKSKFRDVLHDITITNERDRLLLQRLISKRLNVESHCVQTVSGAQMRDYEYQSQCVFGTEIKHWKLSNDIFNIIQELVLSVRLVIPTDAVYVVCSQC